MWRRRYGGKREDEMILKERKVSENRKEEQRERETTSVDEG